MFYSRALSLITRQVFGWSINKQSLFFIFFWLCTHIIWRYARCSAPGSSTRAGARRPRRCRLSLRVRCRIDSGESVETAAVSCSVVHRSRPRRRSAPDRPVLSGISRQSYLKGKNTRVLLKGLLFFLIEKIASRKLPRGPTDTTYTPRLTIDTYELLCVSSLGFLLVLYKS